MAGAIKEATAIWKNEGHVFQTTVPSGATMRLDTEGSDFRPSELLMVGLAGCTGMDVIDILRKKRQAVTGFEVQVKGEQATDHPHQFVAIEVNYIVSGHNIDPEAVRRAIELSETKYCSVMATLRPAAPITTRFEVRDADTVPA